MSSAPFRPRFSLVAVACLVSTAVLALRSAPAAAADSVLVALGSSWSYLDDGSDQGVAWADPGFDASGWASGPAELGYGDGDEATVVGFGGDAGAKFITTYFRHHFAVADASIFSRLDLRLLRDDGAVVYLNGVEVFRSNLPDGPIASTTQASVAIGGADESVLHPATVDPALLVDGDNVLAVEVHQANTTSSDISFDLELVGSDASAAVVRGPYLQLATPGSVVVRWRTDQATDSRVLFGADPAILDRSADGDPAVTEHEVTLTVLDPDSLYYYAVGTPGEVLAGGDASTFFYTPPVPGSSLPLRIWAIGDSGTADGNARAVRDAYRSFAGSRYTDVWLMLGDNAYTSGTDSEYQAAVFQTYPEELRTTVLWPTLGNHDALTTDPATGRPPYFSIFTLPTAGEGGGLASGTEAYYAFDYGNVHLVCLDSQSSDRSPGGPMLTWLANDLAATDADWIVAFWHHPPYSKGSHDSDVEARLVQMRENALPILEDYGVDLVLAGHSHAYERSMLIDGHYGLSSTLQPSMVIDGGDGSVGGDGAYQKPTLGAPHQGAVYTVAGSSGKVSSSGNLDHPVMIVSLRELGSVVLDIDGLTLTARFLDDQGTVADSYTIVKGGSVCGNGVLESGEECDGADLGGASCSDVGCATGSPVCTASCTLDYATCSSCGACDSDGVCEAGEDCTTCPGDCAITSAASCGNGVCEAGDGEDCLSCPEDCNGKQNGKPTGRFCCGDGEGAGPVGCADARCTAGGYNCTAEPTGTACCGDGACEGAENSFLCAVDCGPAPACGDGSCDAGEDACVCAADCGAPPSAEAVCDDGVDDDCDGMVDCADDDCSAALACGVCPLLPSGAACSEDVECCSGNCRGKPGSRTCK